MRQQLRTGTHPAVCGSMAWPGPLGVVKEQGSAQLGTGPIARLDHSHELGEDAGRPGRQWVGLRVHPQQDQGCRQPWHPRETSPTQRMGPHPQRDARRTSSDSRRQRQGFPGGPVVKNLPASAGAGGHDQLAAGLPARTDTPEAGRRLWFHLDPQCPALSEDAARYSQGHFQGG